MPWKSNPIAYAHDLMRSCSAIRAYKKKGERISVVQALQDAGRELSSEELFFAASYPSDAESELVEEFFVELRDGINNGQVVKKRRSDSDWFSLK